MANDLRMVKFFAERPKGFIPDLDSKNSEDQTKEMDGYFHCWVNEERKSEQSGLFREETVALIEEALSGRMYHVDFDLLRFVLIW